jgi:carboxypeptidase Taq
MPETKHETKLTALTNHLKEINDLQSAAALLGWDQSVYMPPKGATARGRQIATLKQLSHQKFTDPLIGKLLDDLQPYVESLPSESNEASLINITRQDFERATKVPASFMAKFSAHQSSCYEIWARARADNNFSLVEPYLEKSLEFSQEYANFFPGYQHIADPLIDLNDSGMKVSILQPLFAQLRQELVPIVEAITSAPPADDSCLCQPYPKQKQLEFCHQIVREIGYDFNRGRLDETLHPFMAHFSINDARITTRVDENNFTQSLFSSIHETGHAFYELGVNPEFEGTPLASGTSAGVHESQSRLWENLVTRSRNFWQYFYPKLQQIFPAQLEKVNEETFYRAINKVARSLIRTDADEVTYNLHIMIRFDLELAMLEGKLAIKDLPDAWNARYESDLGVIPPNNSQGLMQDVHWYGIMIGGLFQGYTLGNLLAAQFYETALKNHPEIPDEIAQGKFDTLREWLRINIHQHGRKYTANQLVNRVTGKPLSIDPFLRYIRQKYGELIDN